MSKLKRHRRQPRIELLNDKIFRMNVKIRDLKMSHEHLVPKGRVVRVPSGRLTRLFTDLSDFIAAILRFGGNPISKAPGFLVLQVAEFFCSPKAIDQIFEPLISDWQEEYFAALNQRRWVKARWISIRYLWKAVLAFGLSKLLAAVRAFSTKR